MRKKIIVFATSFLDKLSTEPEGAGTAQERLHQAADKKGLDLEYRTDRNPEEPLRKEELEGVVSIIADLEVYDEELLSKIGKKAGGDLGLIVRYGVGYNNIDVEAAKRNGVYVVNTPGANTTPTAEWAVSTILTVAGRGILQHEKASRGHPKSGPSRLDISGKKLGVIGTGNIGKKVVDLLRGFGMSVVAYDPYPDMEWASIHGIVYKSIREVCGEADFITLHASSPSRIIEKEDIEAMRSTSVLINCARGYLVDNRAAYKAVRDGKIYGYGIDEVWEYEDLPVEGINVVTSPHVGSDTDR
jgi:D-3-phosphoglycerate dehydrogenase